MSFPSGIYQHYRTKQYYIALGVGRLGMRDKDDALIGEARHTEDFERRVNVYVSSRGFVLEGVAEHEQEVEFVIYQGLYKHEELGLKPLFVRPKGMFLESLVVDGQKIPRFRTILLFS